MSTEKAKMLAKAIALSATKHVDQVDKSGMPYALHPLKVMHYLKNDDDFELMMIAVFHDLVEDTDVTFAQLKEMGYSDRVINAVRALTKMPGQSPEEYLEGVKANPDAIKVKLADLRHNMDARRLKGVSDKDQERMNKYCKMYHELKGLVC